MEMYTSGGGNETVLHLPDSDDFEILHDADLADPKKRPRLLKLMLEKGNFGRAFPYWQEIAKELGVVPNIRNDEFTRAVLRELLGLNNFVAAMTDGLPDGPLPANHFNQK